MLKQKFNYDICKLQRQIENRLCADCNDTLLSDSNTYASLHPAIFICLKCYIIQKRVLPTDFTVFKSLADDWNEDELMIMKKGGGNIRRNEIWERNVTSSKIVSKPVPTSSDKEREIWIKAKYFIKLFMIPQKIDRFSSFMSIHEVSSERHHNITSHSHMDYLPTRILDFYLVIGQGKYISYEDHDHDYLIPEKIYFQPTILSSCPASNHFHDMVIPDMVSQLVFPTGLTYSSIDHPPQAYSIVLTDISRVKIYCEVLLIYELVEPSKIQEYVQIINKNHKKHISISSSTIYVPKALVILSHYPFYHFFSCALKQLYRISLSSSPLPLERYIANLVHDIPLPPQGLTEVVLAMADAVFQIRRPPPNQLPMIDFSYRPLFMMLSIDNIITIFRCLINEYSLCFYSNSIALLTPIQEAIMSLLFPFVWQGVFIPVLERSVIDIIDAPVPYVVGVLTELLLSANMTNRMSDSNTVFVDIDNDMLSFEFKHHHVDPYMTNITTSSSFEGDHISPSMQAKPPSRPVSRTHDKSAMMTPEGAAFHNELNQRITPLPRQAMTKLRGKLMEYGSIVHRSLHPSMNINFIITANLAFPANEHLIPLSPETFFDRGIAKKQFSVHSANLTTSSSSSLSRSSSKQNTSNYPIISSFVTYRDDHHISDHHNSSIFDPTNNADYGDVFDAREIRGAFLRFFVACMQGYDEYINKSKGSDKNPSSLRESNVNTIPTSRSKLLMSSLNNTPSITSYDPTVGDNLTKEDENFIYQLSKSQMFCNFEEEKQSNPTQPELMFFDESIIEKKNRSLHIFSKKQSTPFLDNRGYQVNESYTCPSPSTWKIDHQQRYVYHQYPLIDASLYGPIQTQKVLVQHAEVNRITLMNIQSSSLLEGIYKKYLSSTKPSIQITSSSNKLIDVDEYMVSNYHRIKKIHRLISSFQVKYRYHKRYRMKQHRLACIIKIQCCVRIFFAMKTTRQLRNLHLLQKEVALVIVAQSFVRMTVMRSRYRKIYHMIIQLQSLARMRKLQIMFMKKRKYVMIIAAHTRGYLIRVKQQRILHARIHRYQMQLLLLWQLEHSSLHHRTACWSLLNFQPKNKANHRYLDAVLCEEELKRLYQSLDFYHHNTIKMKTTMTFEEKTTLIGRDSSLKSLLTLSGAKVVFNMKESRAVDNALSSNAKSKVKLNQQREDSERKALYLFLKQAPESDKDPYFKVFGLQHEKKRKQTLSNMVWMHTNAEASMAEIQASTMMISESSAHTGAAGMPSSNMISFHNIEIMKRDRIQRAVLEVARSRFHINSMTKK